jgi:Holliday junction resolvase-like predicted endonuclease
LAGLIVVQSALRIRETALLAEEIVEEWLNRQGYFTIRGIKLGVHEIDLLAVKPNEGVVECRHIEVQASMRPVSFISKVPKKLQKGGRAANSASRSETELVE